MGENSELGMDLIYTNRKLQIPIIDKYGGKLLKEMGDGTLVQFDSAYHAVKAAIDIQQLADNVLKNKLRIGIHLGDVHAEGDDVFGDGVNIASRIENISDPGSIYISESVKQAIRGNLDIKTQFLGNLQLKNVSDKMDVFAIIEEGIVAPSRKKIKELRRTNASYTRRSMIVISLISILLIAGWIFRHKVFFWEAEKVESLAVLPFDNLTGDPGLEYIVAGMHDNLITSLSKLSSLRVISKTSTLKYKDRKKSTPEIATELDVDAIIEASVSKAGDSVMINVQLVKAFPKEKHLWANIYNNSFDNILLMFSDVTQNITENINISLSPVEKERLNDPQKVNPEAYKAYLNGRFHAEQLSLSGTELALEYFEKSLDIDPNFAPAYAGIAFTWIVKLQMRMATVGEAVPKIYENNQKALELDRNYDESNYIKALMSAQGEWNWEKSEQAFKKAIAENPNHALAHAHYSHLLAMLKRKEEAFNECEIALKLDPKNDLIMALCNGQYNASGRIEEANSLAREAYAINPNSRLNKGHMQKVYIREGNYEKAFEMLDNNFKNDSMFQAVVKPEFKKNGYYAALGKLAEILEERSKDSQMRAFGIALFYTKAGKYEKAIEWFEIAYEIHDPDMPYAFILPATEELRTNPKYSSRFKALADKMNLPF
jgi:TolB-like protein/thioredoxin-like negative regulator of GroEL